MNRVFYGYCSTGPTGNVYTVTVQDSEIKDDFKFERGDLLVVHFAQSQNANEPRLTVEIFDTENEVHISTDEGKFVKTIDVEITGIDKAWESGEAVIFVYTKKGNEDSFYWQLIDSAPATTDVYGVVKLFNKENLNNVLNGSTDYDDEALTPAILKELYYNLIWEPAEENGETLGYLSLNNGTNSVEITYPLENKIQEVMSTFQNITHTGQLINNGNGGGSGHETDTAEPFITKMVPENLYFNNNQGLANNGGNPKLKLNDAGIQIVTPLTVSGATQINNSLTTTGQISAGAAKIVTTGEINGGTVKGGIIYEGNVSLIQKYSKILAYETKTVSVTIPKNPGYITSSFSAYTSNHPVANWEAIGVIGYNLSNDTDGSGASYCFLWAVALSADNNTVIYNIRSTDGKEHKTKLAVRILYRKR